MKIERFEDILVWQESRELCKEIYQLFHTFKDYGFKDQIQRASISIMNNIAEGYERRTNNEFRHFLFIAKGSCAEVRSMLYILEDLAIMDKEIILSLQRKSEKISRMLSNFIKVL